MESKKLRVKKQKEVKIKRKKKYAKKSIFKKIKNWFKSIF